MSEDNGFSRRTPVNLVTEAGYVLVAMAISLFLVPYYINELGMAAYAIVPLATSVTSYVMVFSDAFCSAINRYFVVSLESGDIADANITYSTSLAAIIRMMAIVMPIMAVVAYLSPSIFDVTGSAEWSVRLLFLMVLWAAIIVAVGSCFNNALIAVNKLFLINIARIGYLLVQIIAVVLMFAVSDPRLEYIGLAYIGAALFYAVASYVVMKRDFPELRYDRAKASSIRLREIGNLGVWSVLNRLSTLLFLQACLIIANICLGPVEEGRLSLIVSMVSMVGTACMAISNVFYPYYYRDYSRSDIESLISSSVTGMRLMSIAVALPLAFICVFSDQVMTAWVGESYNDLRPVILMMFSFLVMQSSITAMDAVPTILLKVRTIAVASTAFGMLNILLGVALASFTDCGILGIAAAWTITMTIRSCVFCPIYYSRMLKTRIWTIARPQMEGMVLFLVSVAALLGLSQLITVPPTLPAVVVAFIAVYAVYLTISIRLTLKNRDREFLINTLPPRISGVFKKST